MCEHEELNLAVSRTVSSPAAEPPVIERSLRLGSVVSTLVRSEECFYRAFDVIDELRM